ncbi:hypothetical protein GCM10011316_18780 [Roseibium aquae]|uniref:Haem-binding uptake Tiki superfamily ChaN domain-containing protein n=1 Tax=Roseibium aquae TaxID=1323746 RepID=A0A916TJX1_9HYPH|nr:ChaN family lipoprotein [Roseibium aquae]GGB46907.1 hypothetical protein GCM10011316_18780 [Roseibium aquae]
MFKGFLGPVLALALFTGPALAGSPWKTWVVDEAVPGDLAVGRIWSVGSQSFVSASAMLADLRTARFVLAGEVHDNPVHHQLQGWIVDKLASGTGLHLVVEMLSADQAPALESFARLPDRTPDSLAETVDWQNSGWPDFDIYAPVFEAALAGGAVLAHGLPGRAATRAVSRAGFDALDQGLLESLRLSVPLSTKADEALKAEIQSAHCDLLPVAALPNMAAVQRYRDAYLADALRQTPDTGPAVLIAGNGHVRRDLGVPLYLQAADGRVLAVLMREVDPEMTRDEAVAALSDSPADYVWLTPAIERPDPCAALRERFGKTAPAPVDTD